MPPKKRAAPKKGAKVAAKKAKAKGKAKAPPPAEPEQQEVEEVTSAVEDRPPSALDWKDCNFVLTGAFKMGKMKIEGLIEQYGGNIRTAVNKSTSYLVYGAPQDTGYGIGGGKGSAKYKQAMKLKRPCVDEAWVEQMVAAAASSGPAPEKEVDNSLVDLLHEIESLATTVGEQTSKEGEEEGKEGAKPKIEKSDPATPEAIEAFEKETNLVIPSAYATLLRTTNGLRLSYKDAYVWFPSLDEMTEHWGYNNAYAPVYGRFRALPFGMLDYDFCWRVMDLKTGSIWQIDGECEGIHYHRSLAIILQDFIKTLKTGKKAPDGPNLWYMTSEWGPRLWTELNRYWSRH